MVFEKLFILVLWTKVASALEGLYKVLTCPMSNTVVTEKWEEVARPKTITYPKMAGFTM